jgi:alkaline phosphatase D
MRPRPTPLLLGTRQENFLRDWAGRHPGLPKVLRSQTVYASVHTDEAGAPVADMDTNGWPRVPRNRALQLIKDAGAVMLAGDQHLGTLVRHGVGAFDDGPIQFTAPGGSTSFQRWFEPAGELPRAGATPFTGEWTDAFGNRLLSIAVVNPSFSQAEFREHHPDSNGFGDRALKNEGYGILRVDKQSRKFTFEAWRWEATRPMPPPSSTRAGHTCCPSTTSDVPEDIVVRRWSPRRPGPSRPGRGGCPRCRNLRT